MRREGIGFCLGAHPKEGQLDNCQLTFLIRKKYFNSLTAETVVVRGSPETEDVGNTRTRMEEFDLYQKNFPKCHIVLYSNILPSFQWSFL